jgi:hypothetical protein
LFDKCESQFYVYGGKDGICVSKENANLVEIQTAKNICIKKNKCVPNIKVPIKNNVNVFQNYK